MMRALRELRAIGLLVLRSWYRMGPRLRGGRKPEPTRGVSALLMRLVFAALFYNFGFTSGLRVAQRTLPTWSATWAALGAGCFTLAITLAIELPSPRAPTQPLKSALLDSLPVSRFSRLLLALAQASLTLPLALGLALTLHLELAPEASRAGALVLALLLFVVFGLLGTCVGKLLRLTLSAYRAARFGWLPSLPMVLAIVLLQLVPMLDSTPEPLFGDALGRALMGKDVWQTNAVLAAAALLLGSAFFRLERGYELAEPVKPGPTASVFGGGVNLARLERVLNRREPGGSFRVPIATLFSAALIGSLSWNLTKPGQSQSAWNFAALITFQMTGTLGMQRATRSATRDLLARPLLGALPITPSDTLRSKASALTRTLSLVASPIALVLVAARETPPDVIQLSWRLAATLLAVWIYASAATYVAYLTTGLGSTRPQGGLFGSIESFLVAIPFASALFAPGPGSAALSLLTLGALTFEARRAALGTIDWLDDPEREHSTEVWKALVVFGAFQGTQLLAQQLAQAFAEDASSALKLFGAYSLAAIGLWLMTQREQETLAPEYAPKLAPLGIVAGALSAGGASLYLRVAQPSLENVPRLETHGSIESVCLLLVIVGVAPLVEERFFRGWLQPALERTLGERRYLAPLLTALAFAAAHPAYSFVPVFVLGLLNGFLMLRFRSLSACMLAHALHNAFALFLGSR